VDIDLAGVAEAVGEACGLGVAVVVFVVFDVFVVVVVLFVLPPLPQPVNKRPADSAIAIIVSFIQETPLEIVLEI
jgi:hypothetical protein